VTLCCETSHPEQTCEVTVLRKEKETSRHRTESDRGNETLERIERQVQIHMSDLLGVR
jgi:hypothetical protein